MIATERLLSLSAIEGLKIIFEYRKRHSKSSAIELTEIIERTNSNGIALDLPAAFELEEIVAPKGVSDSTSLYQNCITSVLIVREPDWIKLMSQGRMRFLKGLGLDDHDVFGAAGLLVDFPKEDVVAWWDELVAYSRQKMDTQKMLQARKAERLSLEFEKNRLLSIGIPNSPKWPGLDDNFVGYDILSYEMSELGVRNKLIEVKSTVASPLRFFITKNEWSVALKFGDAYVFHVWDLTKDPPALHELTVEDVHPHIPTDNLKGEWKSSQIPLSIPKQR